jgi:hypothetical protein
LQACLVRTALVNIHQTGFAGFLDGFLQKALGSLCISCRGQEKIDGIPLLIDGR